jgi:hypothetical protein
MVQKENIDINKSLGAFPFRNPLKSTRKYTHEQIEFP